METVSIRNKNIIVQSYKLLLLEAKTRRKCFYRAAHGVVLLLIIKNTIAVGWER